MVEKKPVPLSMFDQEVAALLSDNNKTDELTDSQNEESESGIPAKKSRRSRAASTSAGEQSAEQSSPAKRKNSKQTLDSETPVKGVGIKLKIKPMAERLSSSGAVGGGGGEEKVSPTKKKQQDKKRKSGSGNKLIVSFKKKAGSDRKTSAANIENNSSIIDEDNIKTEPLIPGETSTAVVTKNKSPGNQQSSNKKKKKGKKKKLDSKNQKVIEVKTFDEVTDKSIVKVKKKKIYKKRKGLKNIHLSIQSPSPNSFLTSAKTITIK